MYKFVARNITDVVVVVAFLCIGWWWDDRGESTLAMNEVRSSKRSYYICLALCWMYSECCAPCRHRCHHSRLRGQQRYELRQMCVCVLWICMYVIYVFIHSCLQLYHHQLQLLAVSNNRRWSVQLYYKSFPYYRFCYFLFFLFFFVSA